MVAERCIIFLILSVALALQVQGECGGFLQAPSGKFQSNETQLLSVLNGFNYECRWKISLQSGTVKLEFKNFSVGNQDSNEACDPINSLAVTENVSPLVMSETSLCGSRIPPVYFSKSSNIQVVLKGYIHNQTSPINSFSAIYSAVYPSAFTTKKPAQCGPCGGHLQQESGMIRSPHFPSSYPSNCDCKWTIYVRKDYKVKLQFWSFSLEKDDKTKLCHDYVAVYDGVTMSSTSLGKFCGNQNPGSLQSSGSYALVHFHSDSWNNGDGFEIMFQSLKDTKDLSSLRSIAAILGGVSFGIFIFLLLCSVIYKKYINNDNQRDTCPSQNTGENDYLDAVQAAAPPSYQAVMADPEHYPRTPEVTPSASPVVTPSLLRRNNIRSTTFIHDASHHLESLEEDQTNGNCNGTPPPPYPGAMPETSDDEILIADLPPPPTYEMVSDSEEHSDSPATWDPVEHHGETHPMIPELRLVRNSREPGTCTGDGCCSSDENDSDEHLSMDNRDGAVITTYRSFSPRDTWVRRAGTRRGISRPRSDGALRDRLSHAIHNEAANGTRLASVRRRKLSDDFSVNYHKYNHNDGAVATSDGSHVKRLHSSPKGQSSSSLLFEQRLNENNDSQNLGQQRDQNSPRVLTRSIFTRHNHFSNRIRPDSPNADDYGSGSNSPRISDSRLSNNENQQNSFHSDSNSFA